MEGSPFRWFYFFDVGVANFLRGIGSLNRNSSEYGIAFEHFIAMELRSYVSYRRLRVELTYWRTQSGVEVDFLVGSAAAIEVKASARVSDRDLRGLRALADAGRDHLRVATAAGTWFSVHGAALAASDPDFYSYLDLSLLQGRELTVTIAGPHAAGIELVRVSDRIPGPHRPYAKPGRPSSGDASRHPGWPRCSSFVTPCQPAPRRSWCDAADGVAGDHAA